VLKRRKILNMDNKNQTFARFSMMVGEDGIEKLNNSRVIVFGVGGVGSYTVEALARAGVGHITMVDFDETGSIGKRYRRQDEIGTPFCITYDFESENDGMVTVRDRDTMEQTRIPIAELKQYIEEKIKF